MFYEKKILKMLKNPQMLETTFCYPTTNCAIALRAARNYILRLLIF